MARARRGDAVAYEALVRAHQDIAFRTACLFAGSAADAEEAAQERVSGDAAPSPEAALLAGGERRELLAALGALDERDRAVIACRHLLDLSERETADVLGCRPGTVKSRLSRALGRMRAELESTGAGEVVAP